jgi:hypothetical protein
VRGAGGEVLRLDVSDARPGPLTLTVTSEGGEVAPFVHTFRARGPRWLTGTVTAVSHRHEGAPWTEVRLSVEGRDETVVVPEAGGDAIVHAVVEAHVAGLPIRLLVDGATAERFCMP